LGDLPFLPSLLERDGRYRRAPSGEQFLTPNDRYQIASQEKFDEKLVVITTTSPDVQVRASSAEVGELVDRYTDNLLRAALSLGFPEMEAEELVQATFVAFLSARERFEKRSKVLTYLFGILYNKARETRRFQGRHESIDRTVDDAFDGHFDAEEHWNQPSMDTMTEVEKKAQESSIGMLLRECLEGLSAVMRMAFTMKEVEGLDSNAICLALGLTTSNLGVTLFRARNKLRECLMVKGAVIV
jgi:RNA polymerase sigma-70 factor (ECF subfamily)